jgi:hypothetical protein
MTRILSLAAAVSLAIAAGCERNTSTTPSPKTDTRSSLPQAAAGSSTTPANTPAPSAAEKREGSNPQQGQVDPKQAEQHRDFQQRGDGAGPRSSDTQPTMRNK